MDPWYQFVASASLVVATAHVASARCPLPAAGLLSTIADLPPTVVSPPQRTAAGSDSVLVPLPRCPNAFWRDQPSVDPAPPCPGKPPCCKRPRLGLRRHPERRDESPKFVCYIGL